MLRSFFRKLFRGQYSFLELQRYDFPVLEPKTSEETLRTIRLIRGSQPPAILLHGVMPRSGTVYASELLGLHPELAAYPRGTWEFPFLRLTGDVQALYEQYAKGYPVDRGQVSKNDFLALFGASLIAHLASAVPNGQRMLLKIPNAEYLPYFYTAFPGENLILLMRDGRDVVSSTLKTWPTFSFVDVCKWWNNSAKLILECDKKFSGQSNYYFVRYENVVKDPAEFVRVVCQQFGLDVNHYPFEQIGNLPLYGSSVEQTDHKVSWEPKLKPTGFNPIGRWSTWSGGQKRTFKKIAGQTLLELGYCTDLNW